MKTRNSDLKRRDLAHGIRTLPLADLRERFREASVERAFIVYENGELTLSHPKLLEPIQAFMELCHDFDCHEAVFIGTEADIPTLFFAFVHDTRRGLAQGGLRYRAYDSVAEIIEDGLRLSQGMTRKNALAGLWWGGGKGILPMTPAMMTPAYRTEGTPERREVFQAYARFVASLGGVYYTAEDVGTKTSDMDAMLAQNRFQTCISDRFGGSGNPSPATARGVFWAMQAAWRFLTGSDRLQGIRVAVQGAGNVGGVLIRLLSEAGAEIWTCDLHQPTLQELQAELPHVHVVPPEDILTLDVDVLAPCAIGDQINVTTIPTLRARLICGAANNILGEPQDADRLRERGILFVPDYVCNRMGITNCADEWQGYLAEDVQVAAQRLYPDTLRILKHARNLAISTTAAADELAEIAASELHPLLGHRGRRIIDHLMDSGWHHGPATQEAKAAGAGEPIFVPALHEPDIRLQWNRSGRFDGATSAVASTWISTASRPSLDGFLSPLLMDVRARTLEQASEEEPASPCRRIIGADHGGLGLQLAVERSLPYDREEIGRDEFFEACTDFHNRNDAAVREQLKQMGVDFDPTRWIDPLGPSGSQIVRRLFHALEDAGLVDRQHVLGYHCPRCQTILVSSETRPTDLEDIRHCRRCDTLVQPQQSEQVLLHLERSAEALEQAIRSGAVEFNHPVWQERVLNYLQRLEPLCLSRQQWWGNTLPGQEEEVLSPWFSMIAGTLEGAGWPERSMLEPIDELYVNVDHLLHWVVPSQLVALALTGRPAFRHVVVHGSVHVVERSLVPIEGVDAATDDEDRFVMRTRLYPMRKQLGNVVEPGSLIRRFGADALRLGFLLCLRSENSEAVTLDEGSLRRARRSLKALVAQVGGLQRAAEKAPSGEPTELDHWLAQRCGEVSEQAREALARRDPGAAAELLVEVVEDLRRFGRERSRPDSGAAPWTGFSSKLLTSSVTTLARAFGPICPYTAAKLESWGQEKDSLAALSRPGNA